VELRDYIRVLRRSWLLILACVAIGGLLAAAATWRSTRIYAATITMIVSPAADAADAQDAYQGSLLSEQRVKSYADLVASERVAAAVIERLGLDAAVGAVQDKIEANAVPDTVLLRATVSDPDPATARDIADAVGAVFSDAVANIERLASTGGPAVRVGVWQQAALPSDPVSPRPARNVGLGVLCGLLVGVTAAFGRYRFDTSVSGPDDASETTGLPALAAIAFDAEAARRPLVLQAGMRSLRAEGFRQLRTNLQFIDVDAAPRSIVVTSSVPTEGKTSTACNLAVTLAQSGSSVVLVEGDLRRPSFADYLGVEPAAGLTSVLIGAADLDDVLWPWGEGRVGDGRIEVLPSGPVPPNPSELLGSRGMADLLGTLAGRFDFVIVDAPPLLPVTDAAVLAAQVDGALLIARVARTRREQLARAVQALGAVDARVLGLVLTMVPTKGPNAAYYGDYDGYAPRARHARASRAAGPAPVAAVAGGAAAVAGGAAAADSGGPAAEPTGVPELVTAPLGYGGQPLSGSRPRVSRR
jgi:non-specific protein-tyrosine kinase